MHILYVLPPLFFGLLSLFLGQDSNWDLRNYHWYNGYAALTGRGMMDLLPSQTPWFYNPTLDIPLYWLGTHVSPKLYAFILGSIQGLNFPVLALMAYAVLPLQEEWRRKLAAITIAAAGMYGGGGLALIGTCFYDNVTSLGLFASAFLVVRNVAALQSASWGRVASLAIMCGLPAGMMMGLKLPSATFCVGLCLGLLAIGGGVIRSLYLCFFFGIGTLIGVALTLGWWSAHLLQNFDSPLFPYFNQLFQSPLAPLSSSRDTQFIPNTVANMLLAPFRFSANPLLVGEIPWRDWRIPIWYIVTALSLFLFMIRVMKPVVTEQVEAVVLRQKAGRYLVIAFAISYALWLVGFSVYRYLIPMEMVAPLLIVIMVSGWPLLPKRQGILCILLAAIIAVSVVPGNWGRRIEWMDHMVEAKLPPLPDADRLMVLMAGYEPYSHVITQFPAQIPFVRIQSNFSSPQEDKGINRVITARIEEHKGKGGKFALLIPPWQHEMANQALGHFGLTLDKAPCVVVVDRLYNDNMLDYCTVRQVK